MKIGRAFPSEYEDIQRILEDVYGHGFNYFPSAYPSVWKKVNTDFENIFVIREKDKIVSLVRIFPLKTVQCCVDINLAGIGAVSTLYPYRGKGYMNLLLQHTFKEMEEQNFPLSVLGGDRHRYNTFGYENAGKVIELIISTRGLN
ncbi:MAG: GNAT family N-acetyltransferase, partial [Candidatus Omnitrophica bacterium]|nr:GNAT family N-acetyltransferase [Candidatus Omnitrophota bacterium]